MPPVQPLAPPPRQSQLAKKASAAASGCLSGAIVSVCVQPLDVLRTQMQADAAAGAARSTLATAAAVVGGPCGVRGLWRGTGPTVARLSAGLALQFLAIDALKDWALGNRKGGEQGKAARPSSSTKNKAPSTTKKASQGGGGSSATGGLSAWEALLVGGGARTLSSAATAPLTLVKTRMEYAGGGHGYTSTAQALASIVSKDGPRGLFRGLGPTVAANAPFSALYLAFYTSLQSRVSSLAPSLAGSPGANFGVGAAAAVAATVLTQPADVVRTHMQLGLGGGAGAGAGPLKALATAWRQGGAGALLAGTAPRVLKRTLQTALVWTLYEELQPRLAAGLGGGGKEEVVVGAQKAAAAVVAK